MKLIKKVTAFSVAIMMMALLSVPVITAYADDSVDDYSDSEELHYLGCIEPTDEDFDEYMIDYSNEYEDNVQAGTLPDIVDLTAKLPTPKSQGNQGSCVAFAIAYAMKTQQENEEFNWGMDSESTQFSPAFLYNQLNGGIDKGLNIRTTLEFVKNNGVCSWADMPYNDKDYTTKPNEYQIKKASNFKISEICSVAGESGIKEALIEGHPVIVAINVYPDFDKLNSTSNKIYDEVYGTSRGSHAICIIGYDNSISSYKIINSWGTNWGTNGYGYISYDLLANRKVSSNKGFITSDSTQHYKSNPLGGKSK